MLHSTVMARRYFTWIPLCVLRVFRSWRPLWRSWRSVGTRARLLASLPCGWGRLSPNWTMTATLASRNSSGTSRPERRDETGTKDWKRQKGLWTTFQQHEVHIISIIWANDSHSHFIILKPYDFVSRLPPKAFFFWRSLIFICHISWASNQKAPKWRPKCVIRVYFFFFYDQLIISKAGTLTPNNS